ncbi:hypothetical protein JXB28_01490 [Candidatus Woesearchaeota archaeon]|nr:hypothetical protein [Candidatus Woesearchaeota archaeon]
MVDQLLSYVQEQLAKGYKPESIKNTLVRQGYSPALVDGVIESVGRQGPGQSISPSSLSPEKAILPKMMIIIVVLGLIITGAIILPDMLRPKEALLDVVATPQKLVYYPGEQLAFTLEIINMGSEERFDIILNFRVLDSASSIIVERGKTTAISTSTSFHETIELPSNMKPGDYTLNVIANYGEGKLATSSFSFGVEKAAVVPPKATCNDKTRNQDEVGPDCGGVCGGYWYDGSCHSTPKGEEAVVVASCNDRIMNQNEVGVDCGGVCGGYWYDGSCHSSQKEPTTTITVEPEPSFARIMIDMSKLAKTSPEQAKMQCLDMEKVNERDICLKTVAQSSNKVQYCDLITDTVEKDNCYIPFFMAGDYTLCERLTDPQSKKSCETLREIQQIKEAMEQEAASG